MTVHKSDAEYVSVPVTDDVAPEATDKTTSLPIADTSKKPSSSLATKSSTLRSCFNALSVFDWQGILFLILALSLVAYQNDWPSGMLSMNLVPLLPI